MPTITPADILTALKLVEDTIAQLPGADARWELTFQDHTGFVLILHPEGESPIEFSGHGVRQIAQKLAANLSQQSIHRALSDEEKQNYLSNPAHCPWCGGEEWEGGAIDIDGNKAIQQIICAVCDASWFDVHQLADIKPID